MVIAQNEVSSWGSKEKLKNFSRPASEATWYTVKTPPGIRASDIQKIMTMPSINIENCMTSVQITAFIPPNVVYTVVKTPMIKTHVERCMPVISESTREGA